MWQENDRIYKNIEVTKNIKLLDPTSLNVERWAHLSTLHNLIEQCINVCFWERVQMLIDWWSWTKIVFFLKLLFDVISWRNFKCSQLFYLSVLPTFKSVTLWHHTVPHISIIYGHVYDRSEANWKLKTQQSHPETTWAVLAQACVSWPIRADGVF